MVELEEKALKAKSGELKREREAAAERETARRAQSAAKAAQQERETLQSILDTLEVCTRCRSYHCFPGSGAVAGSEPLPVPWGKVRYVGLTAVHHKQSPGECQGRS